MTLLNSTDGFDIARAPAGAPARARDGRASVRIGRTIGANGSRARVRVLIAKDLVAKIDLSAGRATAYAFIPPAASEWGPLLRLTFCNQPNLPTLHLDGMQLGYSEVTLGSIPADIPATPHRLDICGFGVDGATLWIGLPDWFYSGAPDVPATQRFTPEEIDALRRRSSTEGRAVICAEFGLTKGQLGYLIDQVPAPGLTRKRIAAARHRVTVDYGKPRSNRAAPKERRCMTCGAPFVSEGPHHRLCASHRYGDGLPDQFKGAVL